MSANNGVIRIGRKGLKKFAFGEEGEPFEVDIVVAWHRWLAIDESLRVPEGEPNEYALLTEHVPHYHVAAVSFIKEVSGGQEVNVAEALDFIARLREQYDELKHFFQPKSREERDSPASTGAELRFSTEEEQEPTAN